MSKLTITIDGVTVKAEQGMTVLQAAREANIYIPALCAHPDLSPFGSCRLCCVEIEGMTGFPPACLTPVTDGMIVRTDTASVREIRRHFLAAILQDHPRISRFPESELTRVADYIGLPKPFPSHESIDLPIVTEEPLFIRDYNLCIECGRCVRACQELTGVGALRFVTTPEGKIKARPFASSLKESGCKFCGACVEVCPTGALRDKETNWHGAKASAVPCKTACPVGIDVPRYVAFIAQGRFSEALAIIQERTPFPATLGRVCRAPCEEACRRSGLNEPIAIRVLKRCAADHDAGFWKQDHRTRANTGKRVAVVGSGPAGLTCGYYLTTLGHSVTVYEALSEPGGMLRVGIPGYRLPKETLDKEIRDIEEAGVTIETNTKVESLDELFDRGYNAVFVAGGAHSELKLGIPGEEGPGVIGALSFLRGVRLGTEVELGRRVAIIGGGDTAIDSARTALRLGAKEVTILYRRTRSEMPAAPDEVDRASEEGIKFVFLVAPTRINRQNGVVELGCQRIELGQADATGRRRPSPVRGDEYIMEFDTVIVAIGQQAEIPDGFGIPLDSHNNIRVDQGNLSTGRKGVFAGGDILGPASVVEAIAAGRKAARSIDMYLGGEGDIEEKLAPSEELHYYLGRDGDFADRHRIPIPIMPVDLRLQRSSKRDPSSSPEVELGYDYGQAIKEAERCLRCHLRLSISVPALPPNNKRERSP